MFIAVPLCLLKNNSVKKELSNLAPCPHMGSSRSKRMKILLQLEDLVIPQSSHVQIRLGFSKHDGFHKHDDFTYTESVSPNLGIRTTHLFCNTLLVRVLSLVFEDRLCAFLCLKRIKWEKISSFLLKCQERARPGINQEIYLSGLE